MFINHSSREVTAKVVYYGPGLSGKTTNLQYIFSVTSEKTRGELISIETEVERTLFFDLLPINVGLISGYQTRFQLYTVPGQVFYDSTRKLVLKGADGVVFVADSQELMRQANLDSLANLKDNLTTHKLVLEELPMVFQYNKRDLSNTFSPNQLNQLLNTLDRPYYEAIATEGKGVLETLRGISTLILKEIRHLLDHSRDETQERPIPAVDFDTNRKQKIIKRENLPLKKIHTENIESLTMQMEPAENHVRLTPLEEKPEKKEVEDLKVETAEEVEELRDLDDIFMGEEEEELEDLQEIKLGDELRELAADEDKNNVFDSSGDPKMDTKPAEVPEMEELEVRETTNEFEDIKEMDGLFGDEQGREVQELEDLDAIKLDEENPEPAEPEPVEPPEEITVEFEDELPMDMRQIEQLQDLENLKAEKTEAPKKVEVKKEPEPTKKIREIDEIKKALEAEKTGKKEKKPVEKIGELDLFERFKDKTRLTFIKKVRVKDSQLIIDIKDKDGGVLEAIEVKIKPGTKKINLILDVEK